MAKNRKVDGWMQKRNPFFMHIIPAAVIPFLSLCIKEKWEKEKKIFFGENSVTLGSSDFLSALLFYTYFWR